MPKLNLHKKISLNTNIVVFLVILTMLFGLRSILREAVFKKIKKDIKESEKVFNHFIEDRFLNLFLQARIAAESPSFKSLVSTPGIDQETALSALKDLQKVFPADLLAMIDSKGRVLARVGENFVYHEDLLGDSYVKEALEGKEGALFAVRHGRLYQLVVLPVVLNGVVEGVLKAGFLIDEKIVEQIEDMTGTEIGFFINKKLVASSGGENRQHFEYLSVHHSSILDEAQKAKEASKPTMVSLLSDNHILIVFPISENSRAMSELCVIQESVTQELKFYYKNILLIFVFVAVIAVFLSFFLSSLLARKLIKPILTLSDAAHHIAEGNFSEQVNIGPGDEIGVLAESFNQMAENLARRDAEIKKANKELAEWNLSLEKRVEQKASELQKAQEHLIQSSKMASIGQLAAGMAHEINNPMGVILGFSQSIAKRIKEDDPLYMPLRSIEREAVRCKKLIGDLLTFSRAEEAKIEWIDLNVAIDETLSLIEPKAKTRSIEITKDYDLALRGMVANKNQLQQVIMNLCNNAMDAMPEGGRLKVSTRQASIPGNSQDAPDKKSVTIIVSDTGQGIPKEVIDRIFEPFFTTKEVGKGTGLGLSLCYEIIQKHRGTIEVESEVGQGTSFFVKLPLNQ